MYFITLLWFFQRIKMVSQFSQQTWPQGSVFRTFQEISYADCKFECRTRRQCFGFNYRRHVALCMLLTEFHPVVYDRDPRITFSAKRDWEQNSYDALCKRTCSEMETCNADGNTVLCTFEECVESPLMAGNISQFGNLKRIGSQVLYICHGKEGHNGYEFTSTVRNKCKTDGEWLYQSVTCMEEYTVLYIYEGCFLDKEERALNEFRFQNSTMTISLCALTCYEKEKKYFGLEHSKQCFCGSELLYEVPMTNCNASCVGDQSTICGGTWALSVYRFISK